MRKTKRVFCAKWKKGRPWLCYDKEKGMWCIICHAHHDNLAVACPPSRQNALVNPTTLFTYGNVKDHADGLYHLTIVDLSEPLSTTLANLPIPIPSSILPQMKTLFRIVVDLVRTGTAHNQLRALLLLQVCNGVQYELRYDRKYVPIVLKYLAMVAWRYLQILWVASTFRAVMTDEIKVANTPWLSTAAMLYVNNKCITVPIGCGALPVDDRDAKALEDALRDVFSKSDIHPWLDAASICVTVDGAPVLLPGLPDWLQQQALHALFWYCALYRTECVDLNVPQVEKVER